MTRKEFLKAKDNAKTKNGGNIFVIVYYEKRAKYPYIKVESYRFGDDELICQGTGLDNGLNEINICVSFKRKDMQSINFI
ncbi:MAG: hypothetical protein J6Y37_11505 [Paludibacteraceae bacterium]|nr:hypothetical protein [Paludibacteraceae bacterium]